MSPAAIMFAMSYHKHKEGQKIPQVAKESFVPHDYSKGRRRADELDIKDYFNRIIHEDKIAAQKRKEILNELL